MVVVLVVWETFAGNPYRESALIDEFFFSKPSAIGAKLWDWIVDGTLIQHASVTLRETLIGWILGATSGVLLGFYIGMNRTLDRILSPFFIAAYAVPRLALIPMFILWFGIGEASKIALVTTIVFFLVFYGTLGGVKEVDEELIDVVRVLGARRLEVYRKVVLPSALSWVISSLHVTVPYAFVGAVVGEMLSANLGLGYLMNRAATTFKADQMFAAVVFLVVMAVAINGLVTLLERRLLRWKNK